MDSCGSNVSNNSVDIKNVIVIDNDEENVKKTLMIGKNMILSRCKTIIEPIRTVK